VCQIEVAGGGEGFSKICGHFTTGKFTTNLKQHLKLSHPSYFQAVAEKEAKLKEKKRLKAEKARKVVGPQPTTIEEAFQGRRPYDSDSGRYKSIVKKLAVLIGSSNVPISLVENAEFRAYVESLDPRFVVPGRHLIGRKLDQRMLELQGSIQQYLSTAQKVSLCADIWSKKGLTSSYLGITAHFFSRKITVVTELRWL